MKDFFNKKSVATVILILCVIFAISHGKEKREAYEYDSNVTVIETEGGQVISIEEDSHPSGLFGLIFSIANGIIGIVKFSVAISIIIVLLVFAFVGWLLYVIFKALFFSKIGDEVRGNIKNKPNDDNDQSIDISKDGSGVHIQVSYGSDKKDNSSGE